MYKMHKIIYKYQAAARRRQPGPVQIFGYMFGTFRVYLFVFFVGMVTPQGAAWTCACSYVNRFDQERHTTMSSKRKMQPKYIQSLKIFFSDGGYRWIPALNDSSWCDIFPKH